MIRRKSAGTLSPTEISRMSPGTMSTALIFWTPSLSDLTTLPVSGSYSFKASIADSAFLSCDHKIRMRKPGEASGSYLPDSNTGVGDQNEQNHKRFYECSDGIIIFKESQNLHSDIICREGDFFLLQILTKEMMAANSKILTRRSSNCSKTNSHKLFPSSAGSSGNGKFKY